MTTGGAKPLDETQIFAAVVNKPATVEIARPLDADTARILRALRNAAVQVTADAHDGPDFGIRFADREQAIIVETKRHLNVAAARQLTYTTVGQNLPLIVIAADATADARELLRSNGIGSIDGGGYAHVKLPGLLLHVAEPRRRATQPGQRARPASPGKPASSHRPCCSTTTGPGASRISPPPLASPPHWHTACWLDWAPNTSPQPSAPGRAAPRRAAPRRARTITDPQHCWICGPRR